MLHDLLIRDAVSEDSIQLAELAAQLGYPCSYTDVQLSIQRYLNSTTARIVVASYNGRVVGWASLEYIEHFYIDPYVDITGFVVDEKHRNLGIGKAMLYEIEKWTRMKSVKIIRLKSNKKRIEAHEFYKKNGFEIVKEQYAFMKNIEQEKSV
jgi:GNAT superfamily N-acetyltransferase